MFYYNVCTHTKIRLKQIMNQVCTRNNHPKIPFEFSNRTKYIVHTITNHGYLRGF